MGPSPHRNTRLISDINMVPFIDIVLVLLIVFMILSPLLAPTSLPVRLPKVSKSPGADSSETPLKVQITKEGDIHLEGRRILRADIAGQIKKTLSREPQRPVVIEADRDASFKHVVVVLDAADQAHAAKVAVGVLPSDKPEEP